jgi:two-component system cell cycle response regulator
MKADLSLQKKVLIAEDGAVSRHMLQALLVKWGYEVVATADGNEALGILEGEEAPRLAILDWMMPGMEGAQICARVREHQERPYVYMLLLTARNDKQDLLRGLELGADDYLTKPFDSKELRARLLVGQRILDLQDGLLAAQEELRFRATHDALTGVPNRSMVMEALGAELNRQKRSRGVVAIALLDIDHFKDINDTHGHLCGDEVLRTVAHLVKDCVRPYDTVGRYGGEEFLIVISSIDVVGAMALAERVRTTLSSSPISTQFGDVPVTVSLGVAVGSNDESILPDHLLSRADQALYQAKRLGRNRVEIADLPAFASEQSDAVRK